MARPGINRQNGAGTGCYSGPARVSPARSGAHDLRAESRGVRAMLARYARKAGLAHNMACDEDRYRILSVT